MLHEHKELFVVNGTEIIGGEVYGDYKVLHREFKLANPRRDKKGEIDYSKGTPMVLFVEKDKDGNFPKVIVDSMNVQKIPETFTEIIKTPDGRQMKVTSARYLPFQDCKKLPVDDFAILVGIKKKQGRPALPKIGSKDE